MKKIYKYVLNRSNNTFEIPKDSKVVFVGENPDYGGDPAIWVEVETTSPTVKREFLIFGTGHEIKNGFDMLSYVGTAICGRFVWHVYSIDI